MDKSPAWKFVLTAILLAFALMAVLTMPLNYGMDIKGGAELHYVVEPLPGQDTSGLLDDVISVLQERIDRFGTADIKISKGSDALSFIVEAPGASEEKIKSVKRVIENQGFLHFKIVHNPSPETMQNLGSIQYSEEKLAEIRKQWDEYLDALRSGQPAVEPRLQIHEVDLAKSERTGQSPREKPLVLMNKGPEGEEVPTKIDGRNLTSVGTTRDQMGKPAVSFDFNAAASDRFADMTEKYKGWFLAVVLDDVVRSAPVIRSQISGSGIIEGDFTQAEINSLINVLKSGSLKGKPTLTTEFFVGPGLGHDSVTKGMWAIGIGLVLVLVFISIYYKKNGLIADLAVVLNLVFVFGLMQVLNATLTLPGIAGLILTVGMAVDANILILERIREELEQGKSVKQAIKSGYDRAFWTIFDANLTTLITAYILYKVGTGPIKGFAVTMMLGIAASMYTALFFTKAVYQLLLRRGWMKSINMFKFISSPNLQFVNVRKIFMTLSLFAVLGGIALFATAEDKYGIDFTGGIRVRINLNSRTPIAEFREIVDNINEIENIKSAEKVAVQPDEQGAAYSFIIRIRRDKEESDKSSQAALANVEENLQKAFEGMLQPSGLTFIQDRTAQEIESERQDLLRQGRVSLMAYLDPSENATTEDIRQTLTQKGYTGSMVTVTSETENVRSVKIKSGSILEINAAQNEDERSAEAQNQRQAISELISANFRTTSPPPSEYKKLSEQGLVGLYVTLAPEPDEEKQIHEDAVLEVLQSAGISGPEVEHIDSPFPGFAKFRVTAPITGAGDAASEARQLEKMKDSVQNQFEISEPFGKKEIIGPRVAQNLRAKAFVSVILALFAIIIYISFRFEFKFGIGAIIALFHDVCIALGAVVLLDQIPGLEMKINLHIVAAFLTIVGYSLNDTIVVYDRIRENLRYVQKDIARGHWDIDKYKELVNTSINQTISRTLLTSLTTFLAVLVIFLSGVSDIQGFALTMIVGILVGTYSSIFIASPVLIFWYNRQLGREKKERQKVSGQREGQKRNKSR